MRRNGSFDVSREVGIDYAGRISGHPRNAFGDSSANGFDRSDHRHRLVVAFNDNLAADLDLL
jgi:hypothetical protein